MEFHESANIFPMMNVSEFAALKADIAKHGLREPIILAKGKIADGRNRYNACVELGIEPRYEEWNGVGGLVAFIVSMNLHRRHLNESQRAMVAARLANMRQGERTDLASIEAKLSQDAAAAMLNTSRSNIQRAKKVLTEGTPELIEAVRQGNIAVSRAAQSLRVPHVSHNAGDNEWYTPPEFIGAARDVMGNIDLDPASTPIANEVIQADRFYTKEDDGLLKDWAGKVWMNPPYAPGLISKFIRKLVKHVKSGQVTDAIVLVNNATETSWFSELIGVASAVCFPLGRVKFWAPDKVSAPLQGQAILYIGDEADKFLLRFQQFGWVARVFKGDESGSESSVS